MKSVGKPGLTKRFVTLAQRYVWSFLKTEIEVF